MPHIYRPCASIAVFRIVDGEPEVLLVHKPRKCDCWQLPQGGIEPGETTAQAAVRELGEEVSLTGVAVLGESTEVYQYDFPPECRKRWGDDVLGQRLQFVIARAEDDVQVIPDEHEIDGFIWASGDELGDYIEREEYLEVVEKVWEEGVGLIMDNESLIMDNTEGSTLSC